VIDYVNQLLSEEEGRERCAYQDSRGYWSIGVGCLVDPRFAGAGLCDAAIDAQLSHDSTAALVTAMALPGWDRCNDVQKAVLVSMCFQLGDLRDWPDFKAHLALGDFPGAAAAGLDSIWYTQTPARARREMSMLSTGEWVPYGRTE